MYGCSVVDQPLRLPFDFGEEGIMSYDRVRTWLIDFDASMDALRLQLSDSSPIKASLDGVRSVYPNNPKPFTGSDPLDSPATCDHRVALLEHAHRAVTLVPTMTNPLNVLAEGLIAKKNP